MAGLFRRRLRCWSCKRRLFARRIAWTNDDYGTTCWKCRCGFLTVRRTEAV